MSMFQVAWMHLMDHIHISFDITINFIDPLNQPDNYFSLIQMWLKFVPNGPIDNT